MTAWFFVLIVGYGAVQVGPIATKEACESVMESRRFYAPVVVPCFEGVAR